MYNWSLEKLLATMAPIKKILLVMLVLIAIGMIVSGILAENSTADSHWNGFYYNFNFLF